MPPFFCTKPAARDPDLSQIRDRLEDRGHHQVGEGADEYGHEDENRWHDQRHDTLQVFVEFLVIALGGAVQGEINFSRLLSNGDHVDEKGRK